MAVATTASPKTPPHIATEKLLAQQRCAALKATAYELQEQVCRVGFERLATPTVNAARTL